MNPTTTKTNYELLKSNCAFVNKGITAPVGLAWLYTLM